MIENLSFHPSDRNRLTKNGPVIIHESSTYRIIVHPKGDITYEVKSKDALNASIWVIIDAQSAIYNLLCRLTLEALAYKENNELESTESSTGES